MRIVIFVIVVFSRLLVWILEAFIEAFSSIFEKDSNQHPLISNPNPEKRLWVEPEMLDIKTRGGRKLVVIRTRGDPDLRVN